MSNTTTEDPTTYMVHSCKTGREGIACRGLVAARGMAKAHNDEYQPAGGTDIRLKDGTLVETVE